MSHYKVKLEKDHSARYTWIAVEARSMGEAFVLADSRTFKTPYRICDDGVSEITEMEYLHLSAVTGGFGDL